MSHQKGKRDFMSFESVKAKNPGVKMYLVTDPAFQKYGRVIKGYDFSSYVAYLKDHTAVPETGNPVSYTHLWPGKHLQVTLMSIPVHGDIGLEIHSDVDQFIRIEDGCALVMMGKNKTLLNYQQRVNSNYAVIIPAGTWHNIINIGNTPLRCV